MEDVKKSMKVALIVFVDNAGRVLLNRRADAESEMWEFIGGGIETDETAPEAIKREVFEEVGYTLRDNTDNLRFIESFKYETETIVADVHVFNARYPGIESFSDSDETRVEDLELFTVSDALALVLLPMSRVILEKDLFSAK